MVEEPSESEDVKEDGPKKEIIINAWLLAPEAPIKPIAEFLNISYQYVWQVIDDLKNGKISQQEIEDTADKGLQNNLKQHFQNMEEMGTVDMSINETVPNNWTPSQENEENDLTEEIESLGLSKRELLINIWHLDARVSPSEAGTTAECSYEYARQVLNDLDNREIPESEVESAVNKEAQELLRAKLIKTGTLKPAPDATAKKSEPNISPPEDGVVSVAEILRLWDSIDTLRREAIAELEADASATAAKQKFVTEEVLRLLDEALEKAETPGESRDR